MQSLEGSEWEEDEGLWKNYWRKAGGGGGPRKGQLWCALTPQNILFFIVYKLALFPH